MTLCSALVLVVSLSQIGCAQRMARTQLAAVAKDWSRLLRASQMIPVYPLTEDLRPGDVFLVETPIQEQAKEYERDGFLRLDQHLGRLHDLPYSKFYGTSFGIQSSGWPPDHWNTKPDAVTGSTSPQPDRWGEAPSAAYPTYTFHVRAGKSATLALPIKSVPIGASYLQAQAITGSVTIADAHTYGLSLDQLRAEFEEWYGGNARVREQVTGIRTAAESTVYLRLISRVFLARRVVVSMSAEESRGGSVSAGTAPKTELPVTGESAKEAYEARREALKTALDSVAPGGAVKLLESSDRTASMSETFARPLVVGYLSFDFPVELDGSLGPPAATIARLNRPHEMSPTLGASARSSRQLQALQLYVAAMSDEERSQVYAAVARRMRPEFQRAFAAAGVGNSADAFRRVVRGYLVGKSPQSQHERELIAAIESTLDQQGRE